MNEFNKFPENFSKENADQFNYKEYFYNEKVGNEYQSFLDTPEVKQVLAGKISVNEIANSQLDKLLEIIKNEKLPTPFMIKRPSEFDSKEILALGGVDSQNQKLIDFVSCRIKNHLYRLLAPEKYYKKSLKDQQNVVCHSFAKDFLHEIAEKINEDKEQVSKVRDVIASEGSGVHLFWFLAPYIYHELKQGGLDIKTSMTKIFNWLTRVWDNKDERNKLEDRYRPPNQYTDWGQTDFEHIASEDNKFHPYKFSGLVLGLDERLPSHLYANLYGKFVAENLIKSQGKK